MHLKNEIKKIKELQYLDKDIYRLRQEKNIAIPAEINSLETAINNEKEKFDLCKEKVKRLELEKNKKEGSLAEKEENLKKIKSQLYQLKSNKEYQIKLNEISSVKADISCAEEELINAFDLIDKEKEEIKEKKKNFDSEASRINQKIEELKKKIREIDQKIATLEHKRKHQIKDIDPKILSQYEGFLKKRNGLAIIPVKNNNCDACHMEVTPQKINEIKMYERLILCESCVRILYIPEDLDNA